MEKSYSRGKETAVKVITFNIHHGGTDDILDLKKIAVVINTTGADIIGLQRGR